MFHRLIITPNGTAHAHTMETSNGKSIANKHEAFDLASPITLASVLELLDRLQVGPDATVWMPTAGGFFVEWGHETSGETMHLATAVQCRLHGIYRGENAAHGCGCEIDGWRKFYIAPRSIGEPLPKRIPNNG